MEQILKNAIYVLMIFMEADRSLLATSVSEDLPVLQATMLSRQRTSITVKSVEISVTDVWTRQHAPIVKSPQQDTISIPLDNVIPAFLLETILNTTMTSTQRSNPVSMTSILPGQLAIHAQMTLKPRALVARLVFT